ncbi:MAG: hypothetical protein VW802_09515 [Rhodospirillaceae bacterium]|jgi:hypothetical protein
MDNILSRASQQNVKTSPFTYAYVENALDDAYYQSLSDSFPNIELFPNLLSAESAANMNNINSMFSGLEPNYVEHISEQWREFMKLHCSETFYRQVVSLIGDQIRIRHPDLEDRLDKPLEELTVGWRKEKNSADIQLDCQFAMNTPVQMPSRVRGVHVDNPRKLYNALLYMRLDEDETVGGNLGLYTFKDEPQYDGVQVPDDAVDHVDTLPYKANSVVLLMNSPESLHGVTVREVTPCPRRYINFLAELSEPIFSLESRHMPKQEKQEQAPITISVPTSSANEQQSPSPTPKPKRQASNESPMTPLRIFIGYDDRQIPASSALIQSIINTCSKPVAITPLVLPALPTDRAGLTPFTYSRFLTPWLCNFEGWALFMDNDMLAIGDLAELFDYADDQYAIMVNKSIEPFEWASVMLFNCAHPANKVMTPEFLSDPDQSGAPHSFEWLGQDKDALIGAFTSEWNHTIGYDQPRNDAKIAHYTMGIPAHPEIDGCEYSEEWHKVFDQTLSLLDWHGMMGNSVHAAQLPDGRVLPKLHPDVKKQV